MKWLLPVLVLLAGCHHPPDATCNPATYGYRDSYLLRGVVEAAIAQVNAVLDPALSLRFVPSWQSSSSGAIPVHLLDASDIPETDMVRTPDRGNCVFVSSGLPERLQALFGTEGPGTFAIAPADALSIVLLHEAGHFHFGDAGTYSAPRRIDPATLAVELDDGKNQELRADQFAGAQLQLAQQGTRMTVATPLALALTNMSWNLLHHRLIDNFGATSLGLPSAFGDYGYSHPNLELRFLVIAYAASPQPATLATLRDFLVRRQQSERNTDCALFSIVPATQESAQPCGFVPSLLR